MQDFAVPWTSNFKTFPRGSMPLHPLQTYQPVQDENMYTRLSRTNFFPRAPNVSERTLFIVVDQLKMQYGSLRPCTSHDILSAKSCLAPPPPSPPPPQKDSRSICPFMYVYFTYETEPLKRQLQDNC